VKITQNICILNLFSDQIRICFFPGNKIFGLIQLPWFFKMLQHAGNTNKALTGKFAVQLVSFTVYFAQPTTDYIGYIMKEAVRRS
jgi:hypothetical protein